MKVDAELLVFTVVSSLPASKAQLATCINSQKSDHTLMQMRQYCQDDWPSKHLSYWEVRGSMTVCNYIFTVQQLYSGFTSPEKDTMGKIHEGH